MANFDVLSLLLPMLFLLGLLALVTRQSGPTRQWRWVRRLSSANAKDRPITKFEIEAHILEDGIVILKVVGELELIGSRGYVSPSTPALRFQRTIRRLDAEGRKWNVMDCTGLRIIDLCGYNVVLECWDRMRRAGGEMVLVRGDEIRGLWSPGIMERPPLSFQTVDEAVQYLRGRMCAR